MHRALKLILPLALLVAAAPATAAFRCVDKAGKVSYMERPCSTYGLSTDKEVKDPPKADGSPRVLPRSQSLTSPAGERSGGSPSQRQRVQMHCGTKQVECYRGETLLCGGERQVCDSD